MIEITFNRDGTVRVYALQDGVSVSVSAPANQLQAMLPASVFDAVRGRVAQLCELWQQAPRVGAGV